jgi:hypothetical protein
MESLVLAEATNSYAAPWIIGFIVSALTGLSGFLLGLWKNRAEIAKLNSESVKNAGDFLKTVQERSETYNRHCEDCKPLVRALADAYAHATATELDGHRESLCSHMFNKVVPAYLNDLEFKQLHCHQLHNGDPDMLMILVNDATDELKRFLHWRKIINAQALIDKLSNKTPAKFSERTFRPIDDIIVKLPKHMRNEAGRLIKPLVKELTQ